MDAPKTPRRNEDSFDDDENAVDADLILQHKENIQPLASGRRAAALAGLSATPKHKDTRLATERAQLEEDVRFAMDEDDDPLNAWIHYVDWTVENYPQGVSAESGLLELLERATRELAHDPRYKNDMRYLKLWIHYASYIDHPATIFAYMNTNEIGTAYALFYEEYCNALERGGRREEAMEMYDIGIARKAHPLARLQARKRDFSLRMMNAPLPSVNPPNQAAQTGRAALTETKISLKRDNSENRNPSGSRGQAPALSRSGNNRGAFTIFTEGEGEGSGGNAWDDLNTRDAQRKENYRSAVPAQGQVLAQAITAPRTPRVEVYVDETDEPKTPGRPMRDDAVFTLSSKKPGADTLKKDPLRNHAMPPPEQPSTSNPKSKAPLGSKSNETTTSSRPRTSKSLPATKPNERLQIDISLLILPDGTEIHPLERRARDFGVADKKWPQPGPEQTPNPKAAQNRLRSRDGDHEAEVDFEGTKPMTMSSTMMTRDATVTINTKEALMAVYGMYNSPTKSLTTGDAFRSAMVDPMNEAMPTPMAPPRDENAGTARKLAFQPFNDGATPSASRISSENARTPAQAFRTPGASKGLSTGKRTLTLKQALQPVQIHEDDEDEEDYEPVTPAPLRVAKPLAPIVPFVDEQSKSSPANRVATGSDSSRRRDGPKDEEDLFSIKPRTEVKFQSPRSPEDLFRPPGIVDEDDYQEEEEQWDEENGPEDSEDVGEDDFVEEEDYGDYPAEAARWAPGLTPITERTYEHTGNSKMWSTPLELRDRSVMDSEFEATRAFHEAERLAAELRAEVGSAEDLQGSGNLVASQSSWEEVEQAEEPLGVICDPYVKASIAKMVKSLPVPANHRDLRPKSSGHLERLQKFVNPTPKGRKTPSSTTRRDEVFPLVLDGDKFDVHRKLGEGGYGAVFLADDVNISDSKQDDSNPHAALVAIKVVKPAAVWESFALDRIYRAVPENVRRSIISPRTLYIYQDESYHILDYSDHGTLLEAVNKAGDLKIGSGLGGVASSIPGMDEMLAMFFTVELLRTLEGLHSAGFIHGDLKIDNCMVRLEETNGWSAQYDPSGGNGWSSKGVKLIDFGRAVDTSLYPRGTRYVTDWKMDKRDCLEMREGRPWTYETDYYGLAGIVYCLLYGKYMELPVVKDGIQRLSTSLKRYWRVALWERLFGALLNPNGFGRPLPIIDELADIRREMESWLVENGNRSTRPSTLRALVKRLEGLSV